MNKYMVRVKTLDELENDSESYEDIMQDPDLIQLFKKYGGTFQKVYCDRSSFNDIYYSDIVLNDDSLSLVGNDRHFFEDELVFLRGRTHIELKDDLFEME
ncbi:MAG: hypothetical protein ACOCQD_03900 [archaeon]